LPTASSFDSVSAKSLSFIGSNPARLYVRFLGFVSSTYVQLIKALTPNKIFKCKIFNAKYLMQNIEPESFSSPNNLRLSHNGSQKVYCLRWRTATLLHCFVYQNQFYVIFF
jgi:hypothetical protein